MSQADPTLRRILPTLVALLTLLALAALPAMAAGQDPATFPSGVMGVTDTGLHPSQDFEVHVTTAPDLPVDRMTITVCRFTSLDDDSPEVCFMNPVAQWSEDRFVATTASWPHPAWEEGWFLGYKVTVASPRGDLHAPIDGATPSGYYVTTVAPPATRAGEPAPVPAAAQDAPAGLLAIAALAGVAAWARRA